MRLEANRITQVFKALSEKKPETRSAPETEKAGVQRTLRKSLPAMPQNAEQVRRDLRSKLRKLRLASDDFLPDAGRVVIREILIWEFGEAILEHNDVNRIISTIVETLHANPLLRDDFYQVIEELS